MFIESGYPEESRWQFCEDIKCSGIPVKFWAGDRYAYLPVHLGFDSFHHCVAGPFSTQYCNFQRKKADQTWQASHDDRHHQAFDSIVNALENSIDLHYGLIRPPEPSLQKIPEIRLYNPLLVLQGEVYLARPTPRGVRLRQVNHVQYGREMWSKGRPAVYQIDVVTEPGLLPLMRTVDDELSEIIQLLAGRSQLFFESVNRIVKDYSENRTTRPPWRIVLEYAG